MGFDSAGLPPHILKMMDEKDRKSLGKWGRTPEETAARAEVKNEKQLQADCVNLLRLRGIVPIVSRMDKKTSNNVGTPDLIFSVIGHDGYQTRVWSCAIECKMPHKYLSAEQIAMRKQMTAPPNHWTHRVIRNIDELKIFLEGLGL